jgi:hypothetical protein
MLRRESDRRYFVFPSWAEFSYRWEDLPAYLSDPMNCPVFRDDPNRARISVQTWREYGYTFPIQPFELIDGPAGGGIVCAHIEEDERWLPAAILSSEASLRGPRGTDSVPSERRPPVHYLEPMDPPGSEFGLCKRPKLYLCSATAEHAEGDPGAVYWVVGYRKGKKEPKGVSELPQLASHFGLKASVLPCVPERLREEVASWFVNQEPELSGCTSRAVNRRSATSSLSCCIWDCTSAS